MLLEQLHQGTIEVGAFGGIFERRRKGFDDDIHSLLKGRPGRRIGERLYRFGSRCREAGWLVFIHHVAGVHAVGDIVQHRQHRALVRLETLPPLRLVERDRDTNGDQHAQQLQPAHETLLDRALPAQIREHRCRQNDQHAKHNRAGCGDEGEVALFHHATTSCFVSAFTASRFDGRQRMASPINASAMSSRKVRQISLAKLL